jgi:hypothetical protein
MLLRNNASRLITINAPMTEGGYTTYYDIKPGENPAVEVPDELCKSDFVKALLKSRDLTIESAPTTDSDDLEALRDEAMLLGIKVDKKWDAAKLQSEIDKANS